MAYTIRQYETKAGKDTRCATANRTAARPANAASSAKWTPTHGCRQRDHSESVGAYIDPQAGRRLVEDFWEPWLAAKRPRPNQATSRRWNVLGACT